MDSFCNLLIAFSSCTVLSQVLDLRGDGNPVSFLQSGLLYGPYVRARDSICHGVSNSPHILVNSQINYPHALPFPCIAGSLSVSVSFLDELHFLERYFPSAPNVHHFDGESMSTHWVNCDISFVAEVEFVRMLYFCFHCLVIVMRKAPGHFTVGGKFRQTIHQIGCARLRVHLTIHDQDMPSLGHWGLKSEIDIRVIREYR